MSKRFLGQAVTTMLDNDFGLGEWIVRPQRCCVERGNEVVRLAPKAMAVLTRLAASPGDVVTRQELFDSVWPRVEVSDDALTQRIAELRRALDDSPQDPRFIETIPKVGFRLVCPVTEIAAESSADRQIVAQPPAAVSTRWRIAVLGIIFIVALVLLRFYPGNGEEYTPDATVQEQGPSIAVLPFVNLSADPEQDYFSSGISEELLNLLARIPNLRVISRSSSFSFKDKEYTIPEVARQLNIGHVLEGSVRKVGDRVRITAQLIDANEDAHLWSEVYDRELDDIFALQDEVAAAINDALKVELALGPSDTLAPTSIKAANSAAYVAYLRGRELLRMGDKNVVPEAVSHLRRAVKLDDNFAPAHAQLAIALMSLLDHTWDEKARWAMPQVNRALEIAPELAEAHGAKAYVTLWTGDPNVAAEHARRALAINPNYADAMNWLYRAVWISGYPIEADKILEKILHVDPLSLDGRFLRALWLGRHGRVDEAHVLADEILEQSYYTGCKTHAFVLMSFEGKLAQALSWSLKPGIVDVPTARIFHAVGERDEALRLPVDLNPQNPKERGDALHVASQRLAENPESWLNILRAAGTNFDAGRYNEALPLYQKALQMNEGRPIGQVGQLVSTMSAAVAHRMTGDEEGAIHVADIVRQSYAERRAAGENDVNMDTVEAMLAAFEHDAEHAIAALESAVRRGFVGVSALSFLDTYPAFDELRDDPKFAALRRQVETVTATEHEKVLQLICFNNPAPDAWQPLPKTCKGVEKL